MISSKDDPDEKLRLELLALAKETDPLKWERKLVNLSVKYGIKLARLEKIAKELHRQHNTVETKLMGLDELLDADTPDLEYLIPGMLPKGDSVLLIADPKVGKSLLAYDAAFAIATGEAEFLGKRCQTGRVLIVQTDESQSSTKQRLFKRGFRHEDFPNVRYLQEFNIAQRAKLEEYLQSFRPSLVIIDNLRRINTGREISENSAEFADMISELKELLSRYGASGLIIHHANKNPDATGIQRVRGSSAIAAAVFAIWDFQRIFKSKTEGGKKKLDYDPKDLTRTLTITGRDIEGIKLRVELDLENNHWVNLGEDGADEQEATERKSQTRQALKLLQSVSPNGLESREIKEKLGLGRSVYSVLSRLSEQGLIDSRPSSKDKRKTVYYCQNSASNDDVKESNCQKGDSPSPLVNAPNVIEYTGPVTVFTFHGVLIVGSHCDHCLSTSQRETVHVTTSKIYVEKKLIDISPLVSLSENHDQS
jgi:KaiC/GvpD/RAD55 family RecA-like ATPase